MQKRYDFMHSILPRESRRRELFAAVLGALASTAWGQTGAALPVRVLAASDLKFALTRIADDYRKLSGQTIQLTFGSSGNMARQIQQGLPADLFMSADESLVLQLAANGQTRKIASGVDPGVLYALGRLALVAGKDSVTPLDAQLNGVRDRWQQMGKFAIANPEHAPYGRAAQQALQALGLWSAVQTRIVLGENIAQATQFVTTGAASVGITALSLAQAPELQGQLRYIALPESLHAPLRQRMVLLAGATPAAVDFYGYLQQVQARAVLARYGFTVPAKPDSGPPPT